MPSQGVQHRRALGINFFHIFGINLFCIVVATIFDLVHDVEALFHIP